MHAQPALVAGYVWLDWMSLVGMSDDRLWQSQGVSWRSPPVGKESMERTWMRPRGPRWLGRR
jgi:hypothetical protein